MSETGLKYLQVCKFQVGSFNYDNSKLIFANHMLPDAKTAVKSILDYDIDIKELAPDETHWLTTQTTWTATLGDEMLDSVLTQLGKHADAQLANAGSQTRAEHTACWWLSQQPDFIHL